jgi:6-phosphogluconate dehydrogenase
MLRIFRGGFRIRARGADDFADKMLSALRYQFGGHLEKTGDEKERG